MRLLLLSPLIVPPIEDVLRHIVTDHPWLAADATQSPATSLRNAIGDPASPITITNQATPSPATSGQEITYTIQITNMISSPFPPSGSLRSRRLITQ